MRIIDQGIDEGSGMFLNREIVMFTFYGKRVYCSCLAGSVAFPASGSRRPYFYIGERERHPDLTFI